MKMTENNNHSTCESMSGNRRRRAFTLLELLVVIAIMGMLVGLLMPSLSRAREQTRDTQCRVRLRGIYLANLTYAQDNGVFPALNNDEDDGAWQYNYTIYDGRDFDENFGPLVNDGVTIQNVEQLFCPTQKDVYHTFATLENPWPVIPGLDTRSAYGRRYHLSGKAPSRIRRTSAFAADVLHLPKVIRSGHKTGVNAVYSDGHARWVKDPGIFSDNDLAHPFDPLDNEVMDDIWDALDDAK